HVALAGSGDVEGRSRLPADEIAMWSWLIIALLYVLGIGFFRWLGGVARQFQFDVQAGMVGVNVPIPVPVAYYSFGGWKNSLFGDLHIYGPDGIQFYTRGKVVTSRWPDPATSKVDLGFPQTR
ncbi:MAG TPA: aldehyde dehydrogenase family protein, partial [Gaiellaceae bacterium]|nr:aldehyde dehydrogenase family protein [Gaiellaceae bacterium]